MNRFVFRYRLPAHLFLGLVLATGCGPKIAVEETFNAFEGRVVVEFHKRQPNAAVMMNLETESMVYYFQDVGKYEVSFCVPEQFRSSALWDCPEDFTVSVDSGTRTVVKEFRDGRMARSFKMTISRNGEDASYEYEGGL